MEISTASIKELREKCGAGVMDCRGALVECQGDLNKAADLLKERGVAKAAKKSDRVTAHGLARDLRSHRRPRGRLWSNSTARPTSWRAPRSSSDWRTISPCRWPL